MAANVTEEIIQRAATQSQEIKNGTVVGDPALTTFDFGGGNVQVFVVDVDIGGTRPIENVIVQSSSGLGGRAYARRNKPVQIKRSAGGRWFVVGASDRARTTGLTVTFNEDTDTFSSTFAEGFTVAVRPYGFYANNKKYGIRGYGNAVIVDGAGNEVDL